MTVLTDNFASNTGQLTQYSPATWAAASGSFLIAGNQLTLTAVTAGGTVTGLTVGENAWAISSPSVTVTAAMGSPTWTVLTNGQANFGVGIVKDANNALFFELGPQTSATTLTMYLVIWVSGTLATVASTSINTGGALPDAIGIGLVNNIVTAYLSFGGVWQLVAPASGWGTAGSIDVSSHYDFTAGGALTGWNPGLIWGQVQHSPSLNIAASQIQYTAPFVSPVTTASVPNVMGDTLAAATTAITGAGFTVGTVTDVPSLSTPGTVILQAPGGGASATIGSAIDLQIAVPTTSTTVPNVVNLAIGLVPDILIAANLVSGAVTYAPSGTVIAGNVISQSPAAGTTVIEGSPVSIVVSQGLPPLTVPDLFGLTQEDATNLLLSLGLTPGAVGFAPSKIFPANEVMTQNPSAGQLIAPGNIVSFVISTGFPAASNLFDAEQTVISQFANSPTLMQLVQNMNQYIDQSANFAAFYNYVWNINSAQGFGLDILGRIVGVGRLLQISTTSDYVGFYIASESQPDQDWQPMGSDQPPQPAVGGQMYTGYNATQAYLLPDDAYRQLILAKAFANICATTAPAINQILQNLYGTGTAWVLNVSPMAISYNLTFQPTPIQLAILEQSGVIPTPPGVTVTVNANV
jgi:beta-lactam-binding protein with PASTA domain